ncbi:hypothetical protein AAP_03461 [Ascosphaera apis ARSEF 7405]|uniref:Centrosomin N-terminal motif 1 domain-containing protein n=1 Tax=Ascosphaera apis ARSEF 7405 TaxID=392613 RepID=A0A167YFX6_9EURO|nr:hypothetical protein AAP_03461 [Ascosphaera apis ARSEF 7405]
MRGRASSSSDQHFSATSPSFTRPTQSSKGPSLNVSKSYNSLGMETNSAVTVNIQPKTHVVPLPQKTPSVTSSCLQKTLVSQRAARAKMRTNDTPRLPAKFKEKGHGHANSQSSSVSSPRSSSFSVTASRRRSLTVSAVQPPKVPKAALTGVREMDRHVSILSKENFDLKLRLHHRSQQLGALQSELRRLSCLENEVVNLKDSEKEAKRQASLLRSELLELQEEHARSNESNNLLIDMLRRRDDGLKEAAAIICELEDTIGELRRQLPSVRQSSPKRTDSYASDIWRDLTSETEASMLERRLVPRMISYISSPTSIPERSSSLRATDITKIQAIQENRLTSRIPHSDQAALQRGSFQSQKHQGRVSFAGQSRHPEAKIDNARYTSWNGDGSDNELLIGGDTDKHISTSNNDLRVQLNKLTSSLNEAERLFAEVGRGSPDRHALFDPFLAPLEDLAAATSSPTEMKGYYHDLNDDTSTRPSTAPPASNHARPIGSNQRSSRSQSRVSHGQLSFLSNDSSLSVRSEPADVDESTKSGWYPHVDHVLGSSRLNSPSARPVTANHDGVGNYSQHHDLQVNHLKRPHTSAGMMIRNEDLYDEAKMIEGCGDDCGTNKSDIEEAIRGGLHQKAPLLDSGNNSAASRMSKITIKSNHGSKRGNVIGEITTRSDSRARSDLLRSLTKRAKERQNRFLDQTNVKKDNCTTDEKNAKVSVEGRASSSSTWSKLNVPLSTSLQEPAPKATTQSVPQRDADAPLGPPSLSSRRKPALSIDTTHSTTASLRSFDISLTGGPNDSTDGLNGGETATPNVGVSNNDDKMTPQYEEQLRSAPTTGRASSAPTPVLMLNSTRIFHPDSDSETNSESAMSANTSLSFRSALQSSEQLGERTIPVSPGDDRNPDSSEGKAKQVEYKEGVALKEANNKDCNNESSNSTIDGSNSSVLANASSIEDNAFASSTWHEKTEIAQPVDQSTQGTADLSKSSGLTTVEKRNSRPFHHRTVSEAHITSIPSYTRTRRGQPRASPASRSLSQDRGSMEVLDAAAAPVAHQEEWPGSQFQAGFSVDLQSALEFEQWQERERRSNPEESTITAIPPFPNSYGPRFPSSSFVPMSAGSTVTIVTAGANNTARSHQGFRRRMLQPFGKRSHEYHHPQRPAINSSMGTQPLAPTVLSPTSDTESPPIKSNKFSPRPATSAGGFDSKMSLKINQADDNARLDDNEGTSPEAEPRRSYSAENLGLIANGGCRTSKKNVLHKNIPSAAAIRSNGGRLSATQLDGMSSHGRQSPSMHRASKSCAAGQNTHKPRFSSSIFGWMKPSARSRQEARGNIKSLNCVHRDTSPPCRSKEDLQEDKTPCTSPVSRSAAEFEPSIRPMPSTSHLQTNEMSPIKSPFMNSNHSYRRGSRDTDRKLSGSPSSFYRPDLVNNHSPITGTTSPVSPKLLEPRLSPVSGSRIPRGRGTKGSPK